MVREALEKNKNCLSKKFRGEIEDLLFHRRDSYSRLEEHISGGSGWKIGSEFFYGYGTLHRYYPGEMEKAQKDIDKQISKKEKEEIMVIHGFIASKFKKGKYEVNMF